MANLGLRANKPSNQWMKSVKTTHKTPPLRSAYSLEEDEKILRYILVDIRFTQIKGKTMWETMARKKISGTGTRTWQSLKNRFLKSILPNLHKYHITAADKEKLMPEYKRDKDDNRSTDSDEDLKKRSKSKKYSIRTDEDILKYLIQRKKFDQLSGNEIWKEMAHIKVTRHSWQSMRNRFLNYISKNIDAYNISNYAKKEFKSGKIFQEESDDSSPDIQDPSGDDTDIDIDEDEPLTPKDDTDHHELAMETVEKEAEEPTSQNKSRHNMDQVPEQSQQAGPSEKVGRLMEGLAVTRKLRPKERAVLSSRSASQSMDSEMGIDFIVSSEEDGLFSTARQNVSSQPSLEIPTDGLEISAVNEPVGDGVVVRPESSNSNSSNSNTIDGFDNSALQVPDKSGLPLDDAIETAAVVCVNYRRGSTSEESWKSNIDEDALEFDTCSVSDIETNSHVDENEQHSPLEHAAQNVEEKESDIVNVTANNESVHEDTGVCAAGNNDFGAEILELTDVLQTINDIRNGLEVDNEKFRNMIQCVADIISVTPEELLQLWI